MKLTKKQANMTFKVLAVIAIIVAVGLILTGNVTSLSAISIIVSLVSVEAGIILVRNLPEDPVEESNSSS